jgi:hypothetical protein
MAITFSLSAKADNKGRCEILIRYKSGVYSARAKSGVYSDPDWFDFVKGDNSETPLKFKRVVTDSMQDTIYSFLCRKLETFRKFLEILRCNLRKS